MFGRSGSRIPKSSNPSSEGDRERHGREGQRRQDQAESSDGADTKDAWALKAKPHLAPSSRGHAPEPEEPSILINEDAPAWVPPVKRTASSRPPRSVRGSDGPPSDAAPSSRRGSEALEETSPRRRYSKRPGAVDAEPRAQRVEERDGRTPSIRPAAGSLPPPPNVRVAKAHTTSPLEQTRIIQRPKQGIDWRVPLVAAAVAALVVALFLVGRQGGLQGAAAPAPSAAGVPPSPAPEPSVRVNTAAPPEPSPTERAVAPTPSAEPEPVVSAAPSASAKKPKRLKPAAALPSDSAPPAAAAPATTRVGRPNLGF
jgi:hypothetical protein